MSRNEDVTTGIWVDLMDLAPEAKLLYLWSFTNEHNGMSGLYKIHTGMIEVETGLPRERVSAALAELSERGFAFYVDGVMLVRSRVKRLRQRTPQIAKSIAKDVARLRPEHPLRVRFLELYGGERWLRDALKEAGLLTLDRASREAHQTSDKEGDSVTLTRPSPEGPLSGEGLRQEKGSVSESDARAQLPADFPDELRPHLVAVFRVLRSLAERHGAKAVNPVSLASVVMARPRKPLVRAAHDCAAHWDGKAAHVSNVVAAYRNWLDRTDDLATIEPLNDQGAPGRIVPITSKFSEYDKAAGL